MVRWIKDTAPRAHAPSIKLRQLLTHAEFVGCNEVEVSSLTTVPALLQAGELFVTVRSDSIDTHAEVTEAFDRGACAVVVNRPYAESGWNQVVVDDAYTAHAEICHALAGTRCRQLRVVGVTGCHSKRETSLFLKAIYEAAGSRFGGIGSLGWTDGTVQRPLGFPTPGAENLAEMLEAMVNSGCDGAILEVAPEALEARVADGLELDAAIVTTLGSVADRDPKRTIEIRRAAARLFKRIKPGGYSIVNADDVHAEIMGAVNIESTRISFGIKNPADVTAVIDKMTWQGSAIRIRGFGRELPITLKIAGKAAISQALAAAALAWAEGIGVEAIAEGLEAVAALPGRLEPINEGQEFDIRIDSARTPEALAFALDTVRSFCAGKIHLVIGAEGHSETLIRRTMAAVAEAGADQVILTTDNPRGDDLNRIIDDLLSGFRKPGRVSVEIDRSRAIELALSNAAPGDAVLVVGKGRSTVQIFADHAVAFDDAAVATAWLTARKDQRRARA